jgi:hypothetical protein
MIYLGPINRFSYTPKHKVIIECPECGMLTNNMEYYDYDEDNLIPEKELCFE